MFLCGEKKKKIKITSSELSYVIIWINVSYRISDVNKRDCPQLPPQQFPCHNSPLIIPRPSLFLHIQAGNHLILCYSANKMGYRDLGREKRNWKPCAHKTKLCKEKKGGYIFSALKTNISEE